MCRGICVEIARDLADIAVKIAEYSRANDDRVPRSVWSDCRTLFLKNQPIFEFIEYSNFLEIEDAEKEEEDEEEEEAKEGDVKIRKEEEDKITMSGKFSIKDGKDAENEVEAKDARCTERNKTERKVEDKRKLELLELERDRQSVLADADFENYRDLAPPWDEFVPTREGREEEDEIFRLGRIVLGYVVHRLLGMLYKQPTEIAAPSAPSVKVATVILGITSTKLLEELQQLLKRCDVHLLRMEDAINHCLGRYKQEMTDVEYIDLNIVSATSRDIKRSQAEGKTNGPRKNRRVKSERATTKNKVMQQQDEVEEKQTQTPRRIPYDDLHPTLSDVAYIGIIIFILTR